MLRAERNRPGRNPNLESGLSDLTLDKLLLNQFLLLGSQDDASWAHVVWIAALWCKRFCFCVEMRDDPGWSAGLTGRKPQAPLGQDVTQEYVPGA